tara:strand:+ start:419 stop:877 length:459 start_codon:yes stop_codon:yes gene_type:complete
MINKLPRKNKKAFIHTLEATFAVLLILSLILVLVQEKPKELKTPNKIQQAHKKVFTEISFNQTFRECIINTMNFGNIQDNIMDPCISDTNLQNFVQFNTPHGYNQLTEICETSTTCTPNLYTTIPLNKDVYADSSFIASQPSRIVRIYFWEQ